jgi:hypothetical protein
MSEREPPRDRATRYRREASELRARALATADPEERADLLAIAAAFERLADRLDPEQERRERK